MTGTHGSQSPLTRAQLPRRQALGLLKWQGLMTLCLVGCALLFWREVLTATMAGSVLAWLANAYFVVVMLRAEQLTDPHALTTAMYKASLGRFVLSLLFFALLFFGVERLKAPEQALIVVISAALVHIVGHLLVSRIK